MKRLLITTESCSDLPGEKKNEYGVAIIPMHIDFPNKSYLDGEIEVREIYDYYIKTKQIPKTSAVNPYEFTEFFSRILEENKEAHIIHISYSSKVSSTHHSAALAIEEMNQERIHLIDSNNVSAGIFNLVEKACLVLQNNPEIELENFLEYIKDYANKIRTSFIPEHLEYLAAGGRVSNAAALGAAILKLKPRIDIVDGKLVAVKKYRGSMKRVLPEFVRDFVENQTLDRENIYLLYAVGAEKENIENMKQMLIEYGFQTVTVLQIGCVMSTHGGPGAIGLSGALVSKS